MSAILLVGRDERFTHILSIFLAGQGHRLLTLDPWLARLKLLEDDQPDVTLFDLREEGDEQLLIDVVMRYQRPAVLLGHRHRLQAAGVLTSSVVAADPADIRGLLRVLNQLLSPP